MAKRKIPQPIEFLSSYLLTMILLAWLMVLTIAGTYDQVGIGLFRAQQKYFNASIAWVSLGPVSIPLPGAYLVFMLLFVNLVTSMIWRFRWKWGNVGLIVCHLGLLLLLVGSFITHHEAEEGQISLFEGQQSNAFVSYHEKELLVIDETPETYDLVVEFPDRYTRQGQTLAHEMLPFRLSIDRTFANCEPKPTASANDSLAILGRRGYAIAVLPEEIEHERNHLGLGVRVLEKEADRELARGVLVCDVGSVFSVKGRLFRIVLQRKQIPMPFSIGLERTYRELHPGTEIARHYASDVVVLEKEGMRRVHIRMNEPLRSEGLTFYQSGYDETPEGRVSTLAVVRNPARIWPYVSCAAVALGMLIHFYARLHRFLARRAKS